MRKLIERCPACGGELVVQRMACHQCHTSIEGQFRTSTFDQLPPESLAFAELFVRLKGNMKEMERELGVPYSTVRHRLDEVVRELGPPQDQLGDVQVRTAAPAATATPAATADDDDAHTLAQRTLRQQILEDLERGEITPDQAVELLGGES